MIEFKRNDEGILEVYKDGKFVGIIDTIASQILNNKE